MIRITGFGAIDQGTQGGQGENFDDRGEYQTGTGGGGSSGPGMRIPRTYGTKYWGPSPGAYTSPPTTAPPIVFPPKTGMPNPLPLPDPLPVGPSDVPTAGANVVPIVPPGVPQGYVSVGAHAFPTRWIVVGAVLGIVGGIVLFLRSRK